MAIGYDDRATRAMMHARTQGCRILLGHGRMGGERRRWWTVGPTDGNGVLAPNAKTAAAAELVAPACAVLGSGAGPLPSTARMAAAAGSLAGSLCCSAARRVSRPGAMRERPASGGSCRARPRGGESRQATSRERRPAPAPCGWCRSSERETTKERAESLRVMRAICIFRKAHLILTSRTVKLVDSH